jgi:predicted aspartyl protease/tetratricopeptide (TPR) repeat protein
MIDLKKNAFKVLAILLSLFFAQEFMLVHAAQNTLSQTVETKTAKQIADQIINAYGGVEKIKEVSRTTYKSRGKVNVSSNISGASNSFDCDVLNCDDKMRMEMQFIGQTMVIGYDGKTGWTQFGDWVSESTPTATERIADELQHGLAALVDIIEPSSILEIVPAKTIQGKSCSGIKVTTKSENDYTVLYADPQTHLILRSEFMGNDQEQGMPALQAMEYFDYRPVAGVMTPYKTVEYSGDHKTSETIISSVEIVENADEKIYAMPRETEIAQLKQGPVVLPFEYVGNEILVKVRINSGKECKFILDTGASQTVVDKAVAQTLGPYTVSTFSVTAGSKAVPLSYTKFSSFSLGDITLNNIPALVTDLSAFAAAVGEKPAGLIGANILRRFLVTIDYDQKKLVLSDPHKAELPTNAYVIPTSPVFGATALVVNGTLNNKTSMNFLVDTGAAFNNLPRSLAKPYLTSGLLPVGQIYGLDGQKVDIGSLKLKSLKIGSLTMQDPIFAVSPDQMSATGSSSGLFSAGSMGILGNPLWSQFRLTVDYRNERLILEAPKDKDKISAIVNNINETDRKYLMTKDIDQAINDYDKIQQISKEQGLKAGEALALARKASCLVDKYNKTHMPQWREQANNAYQQASQLVGESGDKNIEGQVLASWAFLYLDAPANAGDIVAAQMLITKAISKAPVEPRIYAAFGGLMLRAGKLDLARKFIDQALMLDPSNWQALWTKYRLCESLGNSDKEKKLVLAQMEQYYPGFPDITALRNLHEKSVTSTKAASTTSKNGIVRSKTKMRKIR